MRGILHGACGGRAVDHAKRRRPPENVTGRRWRVRGVGDGACVASSNRRCTGARITHTSLCPRQAARLRVVSAALCWIKGGCFSRPFLLGVCCSGSWACVAVVRFRPLFWGGGMRWFSAASDTQDGEGSGAGDLPPCISEQRAKSRLGGSLLHTRGGFDCRLRRVDFFLCGPADTGRWAPGWHVDGIRRKADQAGRLMMSSGPAKTEGGPTNTERRPARRARRGRRRKHSRPPAACLGFRV